MIQSHASNRKLTSREKEIYEWLIGGYATKEIAQKLSISIHTVSNHRKSILKKVRWKRGLSLRYSDHQQDNALNAGA